MNLRSVPVTLLDMTDKINLRNPFGIEPILTWVADNLDRLVMGAIIAGGIVAVMLAFRWIGHRMVDGDPECHHWRGIFGRVFAKTSIWFMVAAATGAASCSGT